MEEKDDKKLIDLEEFDNLSDQDVDDLLNMLDVKLPDLSKEEGEE